MSESADIEGFTAKGGVVTYRVESPTESGIVMFGHPDDHQPVSVGQLSKETLAAVIERFLSLGWDARVRLFEAARRP
ncbi:MAG TPA: hypothetical protein VGP93_19185 [Polyangiaceae bacterium]|nr:hypothetical protein [Polyangiaceae bacterium]